MTELYWPEETSTGHVMTGIAEGLARFVDVSVLCGQPTYSKRGLKGARRERRHQVKILRIWSTRLDKNRTVGRGLNYLTTTGSLFWASLWHIHRGDTVLVVTNPPTLPYVVAVAARVRRAPYGLIVHDIFPDLPIALNWFSETSTTARVLRTAARWLYRGASSIAVLGRDMEVTVRRTASMRATDEGLRVVTNWADVDLIQPAPRSESEVLSRLGIEHRFVVQFAGNVGPLQDVPNIVAAMDLLRNRPDIHLLVVGDGQLRPWLEREIRDREMNNITVVDPVPRNQAGAIHQACDIAIVSLINGMLGVSVPSRVYNFMAAGRPIVAAVDPDSEVGRLVADEEIGWVVGSGNSAALARAIQAAAADPSMVDEMGTRARRVAEDSYSREAVVESMAALLKLKVSDSG